MSFFFLAKTEEQTSPDTALLWQVAFHKASSPAAGFAAEEAAFKGLFVFFSFLLF